MKKFLLAVLMAALLSGCGHLSTTVTHFHYFGADVPDNLIQDCVVTAPPDRDQYNNSTWPQKEELLQGTLKSNYQNLAQCNADKKGVRDWKAQQEALKAEQDTASPKAAGSQQ